MDVIDSIYILNTPGKGHIYLSISSDTNTVIHKTYGQHVWLDKDQEKTLEVMI